MHCARLAAVRSLAAPDDDHPGQPCARVKRRPRAKCYCPVPDSVAVCGVPGALSLTRKAAVKAPLPVGANVTLIVQFAPTAKVVPHVLDEIKNWPGLAPPRLIELLVKTG